MSGFAPAQGMSATAVTTGAVQLALDGVSSTQGAILYRNASTWVALGPGTSGQALVTGGAGANPAWTTISTSQTLAQVLAVGNATGGTNLNVSAGDRILFGGTTNAFPALVRSSTQLRVRLADDSGYAAFHSNDLILEGAGLLNWTGRGYLLANADGVFQIVNNAGNDFGRLQFGDTTSSSPALKRSGTSLQFRLADDSAFTTHAASKLWLTDGNGVPSGFGGDPFLSTNLMVSGDTAIAVRYYSNGTAQYPTHLMGTARGTTASPTAVQSGDVLAQWDGQGYVGASTTYTTMGRVRFVCDGAVTDGSSAPGRVTIQTTPSGSLTPADRWSWSNAGHHTATSGLYLGWVSSSSDPTGTADTVVSRQGSAGVLGLLNASSLTSSAALRVYNTTDAAAGAPTNAEWLETAWSGNVCTIQTAKSGSGTIRALNIAGTGNMTITANSGGITAVCGSFLVNNGTLNYFSFNQSTPAVYMHPNVSYQWSDTSATSGSITTCITRAANGVISIDTTTSGNALGQIKMGGTTGAGTLAPTWTNSPTALTGAQNPYTWLKFVATDGTAVYVPAFK